MPIIKPLHGDIGCTVLFVSICDVEGHPLRCLLSISCEQKRPTGLTTNQLLLNVTFKFPWLCFWAIHIITSLPLPGPFESRLSPRHDHHQALCQHHKVWWSLPLHFQASRHHCPEVGTVSLWQDRGNLSLKIYSFTEKWSFSVSTVHDIVSCNLCFLGDWSKLLHHGGSITFLANQVYICTKLANLFFTQVFFVSLPTHIFLMASLLAYFSTQGFNWNKWRKFLNLNSTTGTILHLCERPTPLHHKVLVLASIANCACVAQAPDKFVHRRATGLDCRSSIFFNRGLWQWHGHWWWLALGTIGDLNWQGKIIGDAR